MVISASLLKGHFTAEKGPGQSLPEGSLPEEVVTKAEQTLPKETGKAALQGSATYLIHQAPEYRMFPSVEPKLRSKDAALCRDSHEAACTCSGDKA